MPAIRMIMSFTYLMVVFHWVPISTQVDGDDLAGFNKIGINVGPIIHINFNPNWSASMELLYSQKGHVQNPTRIM
jgi:hypothetical protein